MTHATIMGCSKGIAKRSNKRRHVAHKLLIELLACQFAYPVRWIETQDELFAKEAPISRFVEVGPAKVLAGMAKQTAESRYADRDQARSIRRKFLSSKSDEKEIYYEYEPAAEEAPVSEEASAKPEVETPSSQPIAPMAIPAAANVSTAPQVPDIPVSAQDVVRSLVAWKLNKAFDEIATGKSIKDLTGGKSTLQNELVGIFEAEFANLPGGPEDLSIIQLSEGIQQSFPGSLGKESSRLLSRFMSSKMPAGFGQSQAQSHLEQTWGLGAGRQISLLLFAATVEPAARIGSADGAKAFFDSIALRYASSAGISLSKASSSSGPQSAAASMVDSKQIDALRKEQDDHLRKHFTILAKQLNIDPTDETKLQSLESVDQDLRSKLDLWSSELEDEFEAGIQPAFDIQKVRRFDSWWNSVRQDVISLYHQMQSGGCKIDEVALEEQFHHITNRADAFLGTLVEQLTLLASDAKTTNDTGFEGFGRRLLATLTAKKIDEPRFRYLRSTAAPETTISPDGAIEYREVPRQIDGKASYSRLLRSGFFNQSTASCQPFVHLKTKSGGQWQYDTSKTETLLNALDDGTTSGLTFAGKNVLITGAGPKSIGAEVLRGLLMGGARVIVTTSRQPADTKEFYQELYAQHGARGSELTVFTFNQGSKHDCAALIDHIYSESGLNRNLDAVIPFAAISERGEIDELGARSELAHRLMLTNVLRMLGHIVRNKTSRKIDTQPTQVLLPLSPNHGIFGGDGLYSESKLGLEGLLNRFQSESWSDYLTVCGAVIGWTRGTDLMAENDIVAQAIETKNALTFSQKEMAFNLLALMSPSVAQMCETEPIWADVSGALGLVPDLKGLLSRTRAYYNKISAIRKAVAAEDALEAKLLNGGDVKSAQVHEPAKPKRSTLKVGYPKLPDYERDVTPLRYMEGMVDLSSVPVIVGFSELGPWGSSRTRWEMESRGKFTQEGYIEMAWMMNLIKYFTGDRDGQPYAGWVDAKTGAKVQDGQVAELYGTQILAHSGLRFVEPELLNGYDPHKKELSHEVAIDEDLPEFDGSRATAEAFKLRHGENVAIRQVGDSNFKIQLKRGASVMIPKAVPFEGFVAGQIPTGWDATKYGLPEDIVRQVDPVTAYALCCAAEALYSAGLSDASELLQHMHVSEIGNFVGSMMGGTTKTRNMYRDRYLDKDVQGDVMQETYLSTTAAWINMLLLGTAGPIKTPTGACATGIESIDSACESLLAGKTKLCFVGGTDDFQEEESYAFRTMKATVDAKEELAKGRIPAEMSRPTSESRSGFVEGQGSGMQIVTTAEIALSMGLPIYGVIAASTMAGDKISRSVPAPGQGVLSFARETVEASQSPLLSMDFRRCEMKAAIERVRAWRSNRLQKAYTDMNRQARFDSAPSTPPDRDFSIGTNRSLAAVVSEINNLAESQIREIRKMWGNDFRRQNPEISPLKAGLATWGLTVDDIGVASLHGTSTKANDKNEPDIINKQMVHLKRTPGNPLLAICQKSVTGHPKAPAAAFMLNGCLQVLNTGTVPGNRNADNVDAALAAFPHITFPTRSIQVGAVKAFSLTSFGFGQKGGQLIGVHPNYLYGAIEKPAYDSYVTRLTTRTKYCQRQYLSAMLENRIVACKAAPQYRGADQDEILLDPYARISALTAQGEEWRYDPEDLRGGLPDSNSPSDFEDWSSDRDGDGDGDTTLYSPIGISRKNSDIGYLSEMVRTESWLKSAVSKIGVEQNLGVGIDVEEMLPSIDSDLQGTFVKRNFTEQERSVAAGSVDPRSTLTGRWSAKEAVFKSLGVKSKGAGAAMRNIEILKADEGMPVVKLHGDAYTEALDQGVTDIQLSLSHSDNTVIAVALAIKGAGQPSY